MVRPPVNCDWALNCSTPLPVLVRPPVEPTTAWREKPERSGSTSVAPLTLIAATSIVLGDDPKSTRPSMILAVAVFSDVATIPPAPIVRMPREPRPVALLVANVRTIGVPPRLLNFRPARVLSPKRVSVPEPLTTTVLPAAIAPAANAVILPPLMRTPVAGTAAKGMRPVAAILSVPWLTTVPPV